MTHQIERAGFSEVQGESHFEKIGTLWCELMHSSPMWPIHGQYECGVCGRRYPVPWDPAATGQVTH